MKKNSIKIALIFICLFGYSYTQATVLELDLATANTIPTPPEGSIGFTQEKTSNATSNGYKLSSTNHAIWWILNTSTFTEATFHAWVNSTNTSYTIGYAISTDKGVTWGTTQTFNNLASKSCADTYTIPSAQIPSGANAIKIIRTAGTTSYVCNISLTTTGGTTTLGTDATLSDLKVDGNTISGFSSETTSYTYIVPASQTTAPVVTATPTDSKATVNITQATSVNGTATITVTAEDGTTTKNYTVKFTQENTNTPTITTFVVNSVSASISQTNITATLPTGTDLTSITPVVTLGGSATSYTPTGAQDFSNGSITYTATDGTNNTVYNVTLTVASATLGTDATLSDLKVDGNTISGFSSETTSYTYIVPASQTTAPVVTATPTDSKATVNITQATSVNGTATITVTAEDGTTTKNYTVAFTQASNTPTTTLSLHEPEIYETAKPLGGYGTPLTAYNGREYEVYYIGKHKPAGSDIIGIATANVFANGYVVSDDNQSSTLTYVAKDGWFKGTANGIEGGNDGTSSAKASAIEEFADMPGDIKIYNNSYIELHVKGYDQFRIVGKDNNATESKGKHLNVYIDGQLQPMTLVNSASIRSFDISVGEHIIKVEGIGGSNNYLYAFSLRVTNEPRVKYVSGNDSSQVVNQTKNLSPVTYALKNSGTLQLGWVGSKAAGVTLTSANAAGDTVTVGGTVTAPVGTYTYKVIGVNASNVETSYTTGTFTVQTEVRVASGSTSTPSVYINDLMTPVVFEYDAVTDADITITWTNPPAGIEVKQDNNLNTISITGTPTIAGSYSFTVSAAGGNTINGTLTVEVPSPVFATEDTIVKVKATEKMKDIIWRIKFATDATVSGLPTGLTGTYSDGIFTISGTPAAETSYPKTYTYTISAKPLYTEMPATSIEGQIIVIDPNAQSILYLYKGTCDNYIYTYLNSRYDVTARLAGEVLLTDADYAFYDVIAIAESVDATNVEILDIIRYINKPILNFKSFTYTQNRLGWGTPDNGLVTNMAITVKQPSHPIFSGLSSSVGATINLLSNVDTRGIQPADVTLEGSICLATAPKREAGDMATAIHDIPATVRGTGITTKYILIPLSTRSYRYITSSTKKLIDNALTYLVSSEQFEAPNLEIKSFSIDGVIATIDQAACTITATMPDGTDLSALKPVISLTGKGTEVSPASGETVNFSDIYHGVTFTVSDMINTKIYNVKLRTLTALDETKLSHVFFDGQIIRNDESQLLYVYDVFGRRIATGNTDIDLSEQPHGIYMVQSASGVLKIIR